MYIHTYIAATPIRADAYKKLKDKGHFGAQVSQSTLMDIYIDIYEKERAYGEIRAASYDFLCDFIKVQDMYGS